MSEDKILEGHLTLPNHEIVDCGALYEIFFFHISPKNLLWDFFYRFNVCHSPARASCAAGGVEWLEIHFGLGQLLNGAKDSIF
jgi:hypothetical protein